jgi:hypothetical protein
MCEHAQANTPLPEFLSPANFRTQAEVAERACLEWLKGRDPESLARLFHETYERLAPHYHYETRRESAVPWDDVPDPNRSLMIAVAAEVLRVLGVDE